MEHKEEVGTLIREMVFCIQERLSDDLWERYFMGDGELSEAELIELWKADLVEFKLACHFLCLSAAEIAVIESKILESGYRYLNAVS